MTAGWQTLLIAALSLAASLPAARAIDVSGVYENSGSVASGDSPQTTGTVSLQGLLGLEFDFALANTRHAQTSRVEVTQTGTLFRIVCREAGDAVAWSGQWKTGEGYAAENGQVRLVFRSKRHEPDGFFFLLSTAREGQLLVVEVQRVTPTWFGPVVKPMGLFVFHRVADRPGQSSG